MYKSKKAQVLVMTLLGLSVISIVLVGVGGLAQQDTQQLTDTREYQAAYNAAETQVTRLIQKYGNGNISLGELATDYEDNQCEQIQENKKYNCEFTQENKVVEVEVEDTNEVEDYELNSSEALELNLAGYNGKIYFRYDKEVPLEFTLVYRDDDDNSRYRNIVDIHDPPTGILDESDDGFVFNSDGSLNAQNEYSFNIGAAELPSNYTTTSLRITNRNPETQLTLLDIRGDATFPDQIRRFEATGYDNRESGSSTVARVIAQVPLLPQSLPALRYALLSDGRLDKEPLCGNGELDAGEQCDDGLENNGTDASSCTASCRNK